MNSRRSHIEVIADILRLRQASKTKIMYSVGMSYSQLQEYLGYLTQRGFLVMVPLNSRGASCRIAYKVSQSGEQLLQSIEKIEELLAGDNHSGWHKGVSHDESPQDYAESTLRKTTDRVDSVI
ncbi:MAG: hypothetical protein J7K77_01190 [Dehalococcoidales bacterium]|nr:hypothetical protein [Dehalococcoidales bacterium]